MDERKLTPIQQAIEDMQFHRSISSSKSVGRVSHFDVNRALRGSVYEEIGLVDTVNKVLFGTQTPEQALQDLREKLASYKGKNQLFDRVMPEVEAAVEQSILDEDELRKNNNEKNAKAHY